MGAGRAPDQLSGSPAMPFTRMPHVLPLLLDHPPVGKWLPRVLPRLDPRCSIAGGRTIGSGSRGCFDVLAKVHHDSPTYSAIVARRRSSLATWTSCWNRLRTACAGFCCVLLRRVLRPEADYRKSWPGIAPGPGRQRPAQSKSTQLNSTQNNREMSLRL